MRKTAFLLLLPLLSARSLWADVGVNQSVSLSYWLGDATYQTASRVVLVDNATSASLTNGQIAACTISEANRPDGMYVSQWGFILGQGVSKQRHSNWTWGPSLPAFTCDGDTAWWTYDAKSQAATVAIAAQFEYITYDLDFRTNDGGTVPENLNAVIYTNELALGTGKLEASKTGYHVKSWTATTDFDKSFTNSSIAATATVTGADFGLTKCYDSRATVTLTVNWEPNSYEISADPAGGVWSDGSYAPPTGAAYDEVFSLPAPVKAGYVFDGWRVTSGLDTETGRYGASDPPTWTLKDTTLCKNGDGSVYFKNLNPTQDAKVTIAAQWSPAKISVHLNNDGAESGATETSVTYLASYLDLIVPSRPGSLFQGYQIDGVCYWDSKGQPTKDVWDIPTNCTAVAVWNTQSYTLTYHENSGVESKTHQELFNYNEALTIKDADELGFSRPGCTFLGWSKTNDAKTPTYRAKDQVTFGANETLYAVWEQNYYIAYDGNGATEGTMEVQKLVFNTAGQSLSPNAYSRVGYGFAGWATNRTDGVTFPDKYVIPQGKDLAKSLGETNTLYAVWNAISYSLAFDPNGGTVKSGKEPMGVQEFRYDTAQYLLENTYELNELWRFGGWSNTWNGAVYADKASVMNAYDVADGTNTLVALWESNLPPLSRAMHCDNLLWYSNGGETWNPVQYADAGYNPQTGEPSGSCARCEELETGVRYMFASVSTNGVLSFWWKSSAAESTLRVVIYSGKVDQYDFSAAQKDVWQHEEIEIVADAQREVRFQNRDDCIVDVDQMTWIPGGKKEPEQGEPAEISDAGVTDGAFSLTVPTVNGNSYGVWTNADVTVPVKDWGLWQQKSGDGQPWTPVWTILPNEPQLFFSAFELK